MAAVREVWPGLLVAKLTPNVTDIALIARAAVAAGADALAAVNTYKGLVIDRHTLRPYLGNVTGGLSGPAIKPLALRAVYELFATVEVPDHRDGRRRQRAGRARVHGLWGARGGGRDRPRFESRALARSLAAGPLDGAGGARHRLGAGWSAGPIGCSLKLHFSLI